MFRWLHFIGVAFILIAAILLLVTTISSPIIGDIGILKVMLTNATNFRHSSVTFGSFGHCILDVPPITTDQDLCFPKSIGYKPIEIMEAIDHTTFSSVSRDTTDSLTGAFILHPIACGLTFIAGIAAFGGVFGSIVATAIAIVAWVLTLVVMAIDFTIFGIIKSHVNNDGSGSNAYYSVGMWTTLAAFVMLFLGTVIVFGTCCTRRRRDRDSSRHSRSHK